MHDTPADEPIERGAARCRPTPKLAPADENGVEETLDAHTTFLRLDRRTADCRRCVDAGTDPGSLRAGAGTGDRAFAPGPANRADGSGTDGFQSRMSALVAALLVLTAGLIAYQAGTILQQSDRYINRLAHLLAASTKAVGGDRLLISLGAIRPSEESSGPHGANPGGEPDDFAIPGNGGNQAEGKPGSARLDPVAFWEQFLTQQPADSWAAGWSRDRRFRRRAGLGSDLPLVRVLLAPDAF